MLRAWHCLQINQSSGMETFVFVYPKPKGKRLDGIVTWGLSPPLLCTRFSPVGLFFATPWTVACQALLSMGFSGKNIGVVCCRFFPWWIFSTQESNPHLLHWRGNSLLLSHQGSQPSRMPQTPTSSSCWDPSPHLPP